MASVLPCSGESACCPIPEPRQGWILRIPAWTGCWQYHGAATCHYDCQLAQGWWGLGWVQTKHVQALENPQILPKHFLNAEKRCCPVPVLGQGDRREEPAVTDQGTLGFKAKHHAWICFPAFPKHPGIALPRGLASESPQSPVLHIPN